MKRIQVMFLGAVFGALLGAGVSSAVAQIEATADAIPSDDKVIAEIANVQEANETSDNNAEGAAIYSVGEDAKCGKRSTDKLIYCADTEGNPITGQAIKTNNGIIIRKYVLKDGLLDGISELYDNFGHLKETRTYAAGVLQGELLEYNRQGEVIGKTPYVKGKKEGIATYTTENTVTKTAFEEDDAKEMTVFDSHQQKAIYRFKMAGGQIVSGTYSYITCKEGAKAAKCIPELVTVDMSSKDIGNLAKGCCKLHEAINSNLEALNCTDPAHLAECKKD